ncbi:MAG: hypothetical protein PUJ51_25035 [Clostridiales bacterium]|uniref:hypothetical protein n=1 Tax=Terrisporobacter sp. TaxID=1965305 RepID=UPI002A52ECAF|nr:hypothetical protein [Terrisporobacter sp.]MDD7757723.1 hypothetical protein [Clostridiales bacterium]MDY3778342.1 hypothetical protein [Candidatus Onthovivens sp.]MDY4136458.1 hypothetical protein [Terrisporobacter sp.]
MKKEEIKKDKIIELKQILKGTKKDSNGYRLAFRVERVASSGMSRCISIYAQKREYKRNITKLLCDIIGETYTKDGFMRVYGCGMDMLFNTCYELNATIKRSDNYKGHKKDNYNYIVSTYYDLV